MRVLRVAVPAEIVPAAPVVVEAARAGLKGLRFGGVQTGLRSCSIAVLNSLRCFTPRHCCFSSLSWNN